MKGLHSAQEEEEAGEVPQNPLAMTIAGVELSQVNAILVEKDLNAVDRWNISLLFVVELMALPLNAPPNWLEVFMSHPPRKLVDAPEFPPRPDDFQEIDWAPYVESKDAKLARILWDRPTQKLRQHLDSLGRHPFPRPDEDDDSRAMKYTEVLAFEVYEHLLFEHMYPIAESEWQTKWTQMGMDQAKWSLDDILNDWGHMPNGPVLIRGWDVMSSRKLNVAMLKEELRDRNQDQSGKSQDLRQRLYNYERREQNYLTLFSRSDLSHWKISEGEPRRRRIYPGDELNPLDMYTWAIKVSPYNPTYWVSRAYCHYQQAFFDLAIGDAYRAQLLCEVLVDARCRNRYPGLYPRIWHAISQHILAGMDSDTDDVPPEVEKMRQPNGINYFIPTLRKALHNIISLSLAALQAREDHKAMEKYLTQRVIMPYRDTRPFERRGEVMETHFEQTHDGTEAKKRWFHESQAGKVSTERLYPYESSDKRRTDQEFLDELNQRLFGNNQALPWKKCEVKSVDRLKPAKDSATALGVFATEDIKKGQMIFVEEPAMRGHLNVSRLPKDRCEYSARWPRCDNCYKEIDHVEAFLARCRDREQVRKIKAGEDRDACKCVLLNQEEAIPLSFCPPGTGPKTCSEIARKLYHFRACGKNWKWLHDAMRPYVMPVPNHQHRYYFSHTNEAHGTLLSLLLREVFDITLERRKRFPDPNLMAHEIDELLILEDSLDWPDEKVAFPFTLAANIQVPFDILLQLGVDIFGDLSFDTWVIQIVLRKLLINAVPWADVPALKKNNKPAKKIVRLKKIDDGEKQDKMIKRGESFESYDPSFRALYLYPGLSLFNHACPEKHNAQWGFDFNGVPNRVFVWAEDDIPKGEEILIPYTESPLTKKGMRRHLGRQCACDGEHNDESTDEDDTPEQSPQYPPLSAAPRDPNHPTPDNSDRSQAPSPRSLGTQTKAIGAQTDGADDDREEFAAREQHFLPDATGDEFDWELEHHMATRKRPYRAEWQENGGYKRRHFAS
ncbi:hypothetical protein CNMCM5793_001191 [Aspergillus hiratsukae]|uniref:Histone-lysine N-methyltransferase SET5 n=1 Tax=Aspergillus hiratsukae TaxID=1194566 RepID=A0A8H6QET2_9EURO|nr:hypothetical protein CNMCM5793_001191 [Aspergillus hiratsukae]KAF7170647.1 hypothetical protein CNMCM6106_005281 [Aspergillus hiratsukae]